MIFLVDQMLPRRLAAWIRTQGHEAVHVRELALDHAGDREISREASIRGAVIVSKDEDFGVIVGAGHAPQVVWIRVGNCSNDELLVCVGRVWSRLIEQLNAGVAIVEVRP